MPAQARRTSAAERRDVGSTPLREAPAPQHRTPETGASGRDASRVSLKRIRHPAPHLPSPHRTPAGPRPPLPPPAAGAAPRRSGTEGDRLSSPGSTDVTHGTPLEERLQAMKKKKKGGGESMEEHPNRGRSIASVLESRGQVPAPPSPCRLLVPLLQKTAMLAVSQSFEQQDRP